jgi:signal transduction histidine kinase/CheY-like chemotaxis protein
MMSVFRVFPRLGMALAALAITLMVFMVYQADSTRTASARWVAHTQEVLGQLHAMHEGISRLDNAQLLFLFSGEDSFISQRDRTLRLIQAEIAEVERLTADNALQQRRIREIHERLQRRYAYMQANEQIRRQKGLTNNLYRVFFNGRQQETEAIQSLAEEMKSEEQRLLEARSGQAARTYRNELNTLLAISVVSSLIILIGYGYSRRQTHAREQAEKQLQVLADSLPGVLYQAKIDADGSETLLFLSAGAYRMAGQQDPKSFQHPAWIEAVCPEDQPGYLAALEAARAARGEFRHEYRLQNTQGHVTWVLHQATIQEQADGSLLTHGYVYDITDQIKLKQALREAKEAAESANAAKSVFLATMSHEIRTPMTGVIGTLELLEYSGLDDEQRHNIGIARRSSESLLRLLNDILDFSKIEAGKMDVFPEPVSLRQKLEDLCQLNVGYAAGKGISLRCSIDPDLSPAVSADPHLLRRILSNLLSNAIKFTQQGSVILAAECTGRNQGIESIRLSVQDTGVGITPQDQALLFEPFVQARDGSARSAGGTGLGLSICRRLTELMGGTIHLRSIPGTGTTVSILLDLPIVAAEDLPASRDLKQAGSAPVPAIMRHADSRVPVLIVDDHPVNRVVLEKQLMQLGYTVTCVASGEQALARWRTHGIGLILTDCNMPGMDGYALARTIRAEEEASRRKRTAIIACTANAFDEAADACLACGMDDYLAKPVSLERLGEVLQLWFASDASIEPHAETPIDMDKLRELSDGDPAVERHLLEQLRATNDVDAAAMDLALATQDMALAARSAHRMAGASMMVGARAFAYACRTIAQASRNEDPAALAAALPLFDLERTRLSAYLNQANAGLQTKLSHTAAPVLLPACHRQQGI